MKRNLLARSLRASGRLLLFIGAMFGLGMTIVRIALFFQNPEDVRPFIDAMNQPNHLTDTVQNSPDPFIVIAATITGVVMAVFLLALIAKIYNKHMRGIIARIARLFHVQIFTVEIVATLIAWTISTLILVFTIPIASIITIFAFIINELLFIFAWGAYGQPNYEI